MQHAHTSYTRAHLRIQPVAIVTSYTRCVQVNHPYNASHCWLPFDVAALTSDPPAHGRTYTPLVSCLTFTSRRSASPRPSQTVTFGSAPQPVTPTATACIWSVTLSLGGTSSWPARSPVQTKASAVARSTLITAAWVGCELMISRGKRNGLCRSTWGGIFSEAEINDSLMGKMSGGSGMLVSVFCSAPSLFQVKTRWPGGGGTSFRLGRRDGPRWYWLCIAKLVCGVQPGRQRQRNNHEDPRFGTLPGSNDVASKHCSPSSCHQHRTHCQQSLSPPEIPA